ncbi:MAG: hypothetical protein ACREV4_02605 [Gammaproteobacteria bacterium]
MLTPAPTVYRRHRLTVADYHLIGKAGIVSEDERVELIEGDNKVPSVQDGNQLTSIF